MRDDLLSSCLVCGHPISKNIKKGCPNCGEPDPFQKYILWEKLNPFSKWSEWSISKKVVLGFITLYLVMFFITGIVWVGEFIVESLDE